MRTHYDDTLEIASLRRRLEAAQARERASLTRRAEMRAELNATRKRALDAEAKLATAEQNNLAILAYVGMLTIAQMAAAK